MISFIDENGLRYSSLAEVTEREAVNGEKSLSGTIYTNKDVINNLDRGWRLEFDKEFYVVTFAEPIDDGDNVIIEFDAVHEFFYDMSKSVAYGELTGSNTVRAYLDFVFADSGYLYRLEASPLAFTRESFGNENRLALFNNVIKQTGLEFSVSSNVIRILPRIGSDLSTIVKKKFNMQELRLEKNIGDFITYKRGLGAWNNDEDHTQGRLVVEYESPLASEYGRLEGNPIVDERYSVAENLQERLKNEVENSYQISVQLGMEDLSAAGYEYDRPHEGDYLMAINDDLGFRRRIRIVAYETDYDVKGNVLGHRVECNSIGLVNRESSETAGIRTLVNHALEMAQGANEQATSASVSANGKNTIYSGPNDPILDPNERVRYNDVWFDDSQEDTVMKRWNGYEWVTVVNVEQIRRQLEAMQAQAAADRQQAQEDIQQALTDAQTYTDTQIEAWDTEFTTETESIREEITTSYNNALKSAEQYTNAKATEFNNNLEVVQGNVTEAKQTADNAIQRSDSAIEKADFAQIDAGTAISTANSASGLANTAKMTADNAIGQSGTAIDTAQDAISDARSALNQVGAHEQTISKLVTDYDEVTNTLSFKAEKSTVNGLNQTVGQHTLDIKANHDALEFKADSIEVDTLAGTVEQHGLDIGANAQAISARLTSTEVDNLVTGKGYATTNELTATSGTLSAMISSVETDLSNLEIGGRNFISNSKGPDSLPIGQWGWESPLYYLDDYDLRPGDSVTISMVFTDIRFRYPSLRLDFHDKTGSYVSTTGNLIFENGRASLTETIPEGTTLIGYRIMPNPNHGHTVTVKNRQLEKGIGTDWSPAIEDMATRVQFNQIETSVEGTLQTISDIQRDLDSKASTQRVNEIATNVDGTTQTIQRIESDLEDKASTAALNEVTNTVNGRTQTIAKIQTDLEGKATVTDVNTIKSTVDGNIATIADHTGSISSFQQTIAGLQTTVADKADSTTVTTLATGFDVLASDFNNLEIGGRNFITNSKGPDSLLIGQWGWESPYYSLDDYDLKPGDSVIISMTFVNITNRFPRLRIDFHDETGAYTSIFGDYIYENGRYSLTEKVPEGTVLIGYRIMPDVNHGHTIRVKNRQLEKGNKPTAWTPAPEDMATQAQFNVLSDNINLRVSKNDVINQINLSTEGVLISGKSIQLDGDVTMTDAFINQLDVISLNAFLAEVDTLRANILGANIINSAHINVDNALIDKFTANTGVMDRLFANSAYVDRLNTKTLDAISANITNIRTQVLEANVIKSEHIQSSTALIDNIFSTAGYIERLVGKSAFINSIKAIEVSADKITTGSLFGNDVTAIGINVDSLVGNRTNFVQSTWNNIAINTTIGTDGIQVLRSNGGTYIGYDPDRWIGVTDNYVVGNVNRSARMNAGSLISENNATGETLSLNSGRLNFTAPGSGLTQRIIRTITEGIRIEAGSRNTGTDLNTSLHLVGGATGSHQYVQFISGDGITQRIGTEANDINLYHAPNGSVFVRQYGGSNFTGLVISAEYRTQHSTGNILTMAADRIETPRFGNRNVMISPAGSGRLTISDRSGYYFGVDALGFNSMSSRKLKTNIEDYKESGLDAINRLDVVEYNMKQKLEQGIYEREVGLIAEDSPIVANNNGESIDIYKLSVLTAKATQELSGGMDVLKADVGMALSETAQLKDRIKELELRVKQLEAA